MSRPWTRHNVWLAVAALAVALSYCATPAGAGPRSEEAVQRDFVGDWQLVDTNRKPFFLHINPDKTVSTSELDGTARGSDEEGTWAWKDGRLVVTHQSGWVLVLVSEDDWVYSYAYAPGRSRDELPTRMSPAFKVVPPNQNTKKVASLFGHSYVQRPVY